MAKDSLKLPDEIVFQIIARLPPKKMLKFKAVSTKWAEVIRKLLEARGIDKPLEAHCIEDDKGGGNILQNELDSLNFDETGSSISDELRVFNLLNLLNLDVLHAIFEKFSVQSLLRLGWVCKSFLEITTDYLGPLQKKIFLPSKPFLSLSLSDYSMVEHITPAGRVDTYGYRDSVKPYIPRQRRDDGFMFPEYLVVGSMNKGTLVVVEATSSPHHVMLLNPFLNMYSVIPPPPAHYDRYDGLETYCYGVGWDNKTSQMVIVQLPTFEDVFFFEGGNLFSLKENSWEPLVYKESLCIKQCAGTYHEATACLFWIAKRRSESVILRFDLSQRVFSTVEIEGNPLDCLGTINGDLCALTRLSPHGRYQLKVLQQGQSSEIWVNTNSIENLHCPSPFKFPMLLAVSDVGRLLLLNEEEKRKYLTCYSIDNGLLKEVESPMSVKSIYHRQGMEYQETTTLPSYYFQFYKSLLTFKKEDIKGKRVLLRCDLDWWSDKTFVTHDLEISDDDMLSDDDMFSDDDDIDYMPIFTALPTIKYLLSYGARLIIAAHVGSPKGVTAELSLKPLVPILKELLGIEVKMAEDCIGSTVKELVGKIPEGGVLMLENLRFYKEEEDNDAMFAMKLASVADLYVNDAFAIAHKAYASTEGIARYLRPCVGGFLMQKELDYMVGALPSLKKPFAVIVGGSKISSKMDAIESLLSKVDVLFIGGGISYTFFKAKGFQVGSSVVGEEDKVEAAYTILEKADSLGVPVLLPTDVVIASPDGHTKIVPPCNIPEGWMGVDIGPDSIRSFGDCLKTMKSVVWNGPLGVCEHKKFSRGTQAIARRLGSVSADTDTIIGGRDLVRAVMEIGVAQKMSHISTGGEALLELVIKGRRLPGVCALDES